MVPNCQNNCKLRPICLTHRGKNSDEYVICTGLASKSSEISQHMRIAEWGFKGAVAPLTKGNTCNLSTSKLLNPN